MMTNTMRFAGVELGGTKTIAVLSAGERIIDRLSVATTTPDTTLGVIQGQLAKWHSEQAIEALGIASFGPVRLDPAAADYGAILTTPKAGWSGASVLARLTEGLGCPAAIDTDVNAAALAEHRWGAGQGASSLVYLTIGTGLGGGVLVDGRPVHGRLHPEIGHILTRRAPRDRFAGACPFHGDCIEGLISGPALAQRFGVSADQVAADDPRWQAVGHDLAQLLATLIHTLAPQRILVGGGVGLGAAGLLDQAVDRLPALLAGYYPDLDRERLRTIIGLPSLGADAGPMGAIALASQALEGKLEARAGIEPACKDLQSSA